ncbi:MAG: putative O-glycosylation ligase, exosortase A system-associated [Candidatus Entotheonellia bacterium]
MRDLLLIAIVILCALVALRRPVFGMLTFVCLGFLNPHSMTWTIARSFRLSLLVALATIIGYLFWSEPKSFPRQRESFLLLALWGMFGISTSFAIEPEIAFQHFLDISKILLMVFLCTAIINTEERLRWLIQVIAFSLGFYAVKGGIFVIVSGGNELVWGPEDSFLYANNSIGLALAMNIPLLLYLLKLETRSRLRWIIRGMLVFSYPAIIGTFSRGAWLGLGVVTTLCFLNMKRKLLLSTVGTLIGIMLLPLALQRVPERVVDRYNQLVNYESEASAQSRFWNWELCKRVGLAHPWTGGGFDPYTFRLIAKYYPEFSDRWGQWKVWSCHSVWFSIFAEHGFPGLILWLGLIGSYFLSIGQIRSYGRTHPNMEWVVHCAHMLSTALVAFMVVGTFLDAAYFDMVYYLVAILIIVKERISQATAESAFPVTAPIKHEPVFKRQRISVGG